MSRPVLSILAFVVSFVGCAGTQKPAEAPEPAETDTSSHLTSATAGRPIQSGGEITSGANPLSRPAAGDAAPATATASSAPATDSSLEAAVIRGDALPPPPATSATKAAKVKKTGKKKTAKPH